MFMFMFKFMSMYIMSEEKKQESNSLYVFTYWPNKADPDFSDSDVCAKAVAM